MSSPSALPLGLGYRPLRASDAPAALQLLNAYDRAFFGEPLIELADLLAELTAPGLDPGTDTLSAWTATGALLGFAILGTRGHIEAGVAAGQEPLRDALDDRTETRARSRGSTSVTQYVARDDHPGARRLAARGYVLDHTAWILRLTDGAVLTTRILPAGYRVRSFELDDAEATFTVINDAFAEWEKGPHRTFADWRAGTLQRTGVDPRTFRVATYGDEIIGACVVYDSGQEAWVSQLATHRDHRGRGVAQRLLADTFAAARERGLTGGGLSTDTRTGALDLYLRLGMTVRHTVDCWALDLTDAA